MYCYCNLGNALNSVFESMQVSVLIDNIEDIEENPETAQILCSFEDACKSYELTWAIREASERSRMAKKEASTSTA